MKKYLLPKKEDVSFYKANLHCHSNISDGTKTPLELKELYKSHGYSILAYTDHDCFIPHNELTDENFLALSGFELQYNENGVYPSNKDIQSTHFCFIAKSKDIVMHPDWNEKCAYIGNSAEYKALVKFDKKKVSVERNRSAQCIRESIKKAKAAGFFVTYNHPTWSLDKYTDYIQYEGFDAMEIFNNDCHTLGYNSYEPGVYDDFLRAGQRIYAVAADDNHNKFPETDPRFDSFGGFTMIAAPNLNYESVINALVSGDFYASQGPEIYEIYIEDETLYVKCSNAVMVTLSTNRRSSQTVLANKEEFINSAVFRVDKDDEYIRITVQDAVGKHANSRAYFRDEYIK